MDRRSAIKTAIAAAVAIVLPKTAPACPPDSPGNWTELPDCDCCCTPVMPDSLTLTVDDQVIATYTRDPCTGEYVER